jgi:hypothetical protein
VSYVRNIRKIVEIDTVEPYSTCKIHWT